MDDDEEWDDRGPPPPKKDNPLETLAWALFWLTLFAGAVCVFVVLSDTHHIEDHSHHIDNRTLELLGRLEQASLCSSEAWDEELSVSMNLTHSGLGGPTAIFFARLPGDDPELGQRMFVAQQHGVVHYSEQGGGGDMTLLADVSSALTPLSSLYDEEGLLGLEFHPNFINNGRFFLYYVVPPVGADGEPSCSILPPNRVEGEDLLYNETEYANMLVLEEWRAYSHESGDMATYTKRILTVKHPYRNHLGIDNLMFEETNGDLLVVLGDGGCYYDQFGFAQNRSHLLGKVLVVEVDSTSVPLDECTTPVATWDELESACSNTSELVRLYAMGVRNGGHMSTDTYQGIKNQYLAFVGQNVVEAIYHMDYEDNYGWVTREGFLCTCLEGDPLRPQRCDFTQTQEECESEEYSITGGFKYPLVTNNQLVDRVSAIVGGHVYRGSDLPCPFWGAYMYADWSQHDNTGSFPAKVDGTPSLWMVRPDHNAPHSQVPRSKGRIQIASGLVGERNYVNSMGYNKETRELFIGMNGGVAPMVDGEPTTLGRIYKIIAA
jgi:hypothetical protein